MAIEIRELVIKTEIKTGNNAQKNAYQHDELIQFKQNLMNECKRLISESAKRSLDKR
jgi:hypothetical protein